MIREREGGGIDMILDEELPSEYATKSLLKVDIKHEDPSAYYDIIGKIAVGAFAKVFEV